MISNERIKEIEKGFHKNEFARDPWQCYSDMEDQIEELLAERKQLVEIANCVDRFLNTDYESSIKIISLRAYLKEWKGNDN